MQKIHETVEQVEELQKSLALKRGELEAKNQAANAKLKEMVNKYSVILLWLLLLFRVGT